MGPHEPQNRDEPPVLRGVPCDDDARDASRRCGFREPSHGHDVFRFQDGFAEILFK